MLLPVTGWWDTTYSALRPNSFPKVTFYSKKIILKVYLGQSQRQEAAFPLKLAKRNPTLSQCFFNKEAEANVLQTDAAREKRKKKALLWTTNKHEMHNPYQGQCFCFLKSPCKFPEISWAFQVLAPGLHSLLLTPLSCPVINTVTC